MWFWLGLAVINLVKAQIRSLSVIDDLSRNQVSFRHWEPYVWEYSSTLMVLSLVFLVAFWVKKYPLLNQFSKTHLIWHIIGSVVFSLLHVVFMVLIRKAIYYFLNSHYDFGDWASQWWYEYRKDVITYFTLLLLIELYIYFQLGSNNQSEAKVNQLKIKNQKGVFLLNPDEIITIESGGNYVYIHVNDEVLLHRETMAEMLNQLDPSRFLQVHRSYIVNLSKIKGLKDKGKDPCTLVLLNGKELPVSRKHRRNVLSLMAM